MWRHHCIFVLYHAFALTRALRARRARPPEVQPRAHGAACVSTWLGESCVKYNLFDVAQTLIRGRVRGPARARERGTIYQISDIQFNDVIIYSSRCVASLDWVRLRGIFGAGDCILASNFCIDVEKLSNIQKRQMFKTD